MCSAHVVDFSKRRDCEIQAGDRDQDRPQRSHWRRWALANKVACCKLTLLEEEPPSMSLGVVLFLRYDSITSLAPGSTSCRPVG
jgi:hypothetical protein